MSWLNKITEAAKKISKDATDLYNDHAPTINQHLNKIEKEVIKSYDNFSKQHEATVSIPLIRTV